MSVQQSLQWQRPRPASDHELDAIKLTVDVAVGDTVFRAGTSLLQLVNQHRAMMKRLEGKEIL